MTLALFPRQFKVLYADPMAGSDLGGINTVHVGNVSSAAAGPLGVFVAVSVATFLLMLDLTVVNVALSDIAQSLSADFGELELVLNVYALGLAVFVLTAGAIGDRFGRTRVFSVGLVLFVLASLACGCAVTSAWLIGARGLQSVAAAVLFAIGPAMIADAFPERSRGMAYGVFGAVAGSAIAFGPLIGGLIIGATSWRWIFLMNVPLGIIAIFVLIPHLRNVTAPVAAAAFGHRDVVAFTLSATGLVMSIHIVGGGSRPPGLVVGVLAFTVMSVIMFVAFELHGGDTALIPTHFFRRRSLVGLNVATFLNGAVVIASIFILAAFVEQIWGLTALEVGIRFLPLTLSVVVGSLLAGALANRLSNEVVLGISLAVLAIGLGSIAPIVEGPDSVSALIPSMMAVGLGMGLFNPPRAALAVSLVPQRLGATSTGTNETAQQLGAAIGIAVFGSLYAAGGTGTAADLRMPLVIAAICAAVGAGVVLAILRAPHPLQTGDLVEFAPHSKTSE